MSEREAKKRDDTEPSAASVDALLGVSASLRRARAAQPPALPFAALRPQIPPRPLALGLSLDFLRDDGGAGAAPHAFRQPAALQRAGEPARPEPTSDGPALGELVPAWGLLPTHAPRPPARSAVADAPPALAAAAAATATLARAGEQEGVPRRPERVVWSTGSGIERVPARAPEPPAARGALPRTEPVAGAPRNGVGQAPPPPPEVLPWSAPVAAPREEALRAAAPPDAPALLPWSSSRPAPGAVDRADAAAGAPASEEAEAPRLVEVHRSKSQLLDRLAQLGDTLPDLVKAEVEKAVRSLPEKRAPERPAPPPVDVTGDRFMQGVSGWMQARAHEDRIRTRGLR